MFEIKEDFVFEERPYYCMEKVVKILGVTKQTVHNRANKLGICSIYRKRNKYYSAHQIRELFYNGEEAK